MHNKIETATASNYVNGLNSWKVEMCIKLTIVGAIITGAAVCGGGVHNCFDT